MGETTGIAWCDMTFNAWIGCAKVSPACEHCYAEADDRHWRGGMNWGVKGKRTRTSAAYWRKPVQWDKDAVKAGVRRRVFCASMADVFEDRRDLDPWRKDLWALIERTPNLDWLLLTKRPQQIMPLTPAEWTVDLSSGWPPNVWLGTTAENQEQVEKRLTFLTGMRRCYGLPIAFVSVEPALGPVDLRQHLGREHGINWVIWGGESGTSARFAPAHWAEEVRRQCLASRVPFFMKQLGGIRNKRDRLEDFPPDLRVREFPK